MTQDNNIPMITNDQMLENHSTPFIEQLDELGTPVNAYNLRSKS